MEPPDREWSERAHAGRTDDLLDPTAREVEVWLAYIRYGGYQQAADSLGLSVATVANHLANLMARMEAANVTHLVQLMWERYPNVRPLMNLPGNRRKGQRRCTR